LYYNIQSMHTAVRVNPIPFIEYQKNFKENDKNGI